MRVEVHKELTCGVPLSEVGFGSVVARWIEPTPTYYLVVSPMDGSGRRLLVSLGAGTMRHLPQDTLVIPVDAHVVIGQR